MPKKKKKKKSWKEIQQERQRAQEAARIRLEIERKYKKRRKGWPSGKVVGGICLVALLLVSYGVWQYVQPPQPSTEPPPINPTPSEPSQTTLASDFTLRDINGTQFSLSSFSGKVVVLHIMGVGCHGQIYSINDNQLTQLKTVCGSYCSNKPVTLITVAVATCPDSDLAQIRTTYGITWLFGNDYDDGKMDIAQKYATQGDGTIVLIDKTFHISDSYSTITASTLSSKIDQLLGA
ncbi:MAG: peroxiredoxin family protein [Candidatus Bathyarchaeaceae archaeon]